MICTIYSDKFKHSANSIGSNPEDKGLLFLGWLFEPPRKTSLPFQWQKDILPIELIRGPLQHSQKRKSDQL